MSLQDDYNITLEILGIENELDQIEQLKEQLSGHKRMQAECNIANKKLRKIKKLCKEISNDKMAMSGEHLIADDILEILEEQE